MNIFVVSPYLFVVNVKYGILRLISCWNYGSVIVFTVETTCLETRAFPER